MSTSLLLPDIMEFILTTCTEGSEKATTTNFYKLIKHILTHENDFKCGIPYFCLFENEEYIDLITHDYVMFNPIYDKCLGCFMFNTINDMFFGCKAILKKINIEYPNDHIVKDKLDQFDHFIKITEDHVDMMELCSSFKKKSFV